MFPEIWSKRKSSITSTNTDEEEGLRILTKIAIANSNVVVKPISLLKSDDHRSSDYCYLKFCHLCIKPLNLEKEIYMYRGDLGFCSVECRERQIYMDETKEMEANTQRIFSTFRHRSGAGGRCETTKLLEEFRRRRRHPFSSTTTTTERVVFSYS